MNPAGRGASFQPSHDFRGFADGILRADERTTTAPMAQFWEYQRFAAQHDDSVVLADLCTLAASIAQVIVHLWDQQVDILLLFECRPQEQVGVGRLDVTV
jgi:hypothetical protein